MSDLKARFSNMDWQTVAVLAGVVGLFALTAVAFYFQKKGDVPRTGAAANVVTQKYGSWVVACPKEGAGKCMANLRIMNKDGKSLLLNWVLVPGKDGGVVNIMQVPKSIGLKTATDTLSGVDPARGLDLKFGDYPIRHLPFRKCSAQFCDAAAPIDADFSAQAAAEGKTSVTVYTSEGKPIPLILAQTGADQAINALVDRQ